MLTDIGVGEPHSYSRAYGVNDAGVTVGFAWDLFQPNDTILFDGSTWFQIGGFGQFQNSEGRDVNNAAVQQTPTSAWSMYRAIVGVGIACALINHTSRGSSELAISSSAVA